MDLIFVLLTQLINLTTFDLDFQVDHGRRLLPKLRRGKTRFAKLSRILRRILESDPGWKIRVLKGGEFTGIELDPQVMLNFVRVIFRVEDDGSNSIVLCVDGVRENRGTDVLLRHRYFGCMRNIYWNSRPVEAIDRSDSRLATKLRNLGGHCQNLASYVDKQKRYDQSTQKEISKRKTQDPPLDHQSKVDKTKIPLAHKARPRDNPGPPDPHTRSREQKSTKGKKYDTNATVPEKKARPAPLPVSPPVGHEEHTRTYNKSNTYEPWPNGTTTAQQARPRDDESSSYVVENDSFSHGTMISFALIIFVLVKFFL